MLFAKNEGISSSDVKSLFVTDFMTLLPPSGMRDMRHMFVTRSRQPRMMVSPLKVISHPCQCKKTSQPASHKTETERRLLVIEGVSWASWAALCNLFSKSSNVVVVNICAPADWMIVLVGSWVLLYLLEHLNWGGIHLLLSLQVQWCFNLKDWHSQK